MVGTQRVTYVAFEARVDGGRVGSGEARAIRLSPVGQLNTLNAAGRRRIVFDELDAAL